ncbi:unnamed protein product [Cuscuta europaea]|uniref:RRM domain-containing protein n=1 Tax=Cuscuta europaea TaxID=41803 RepID=A0A9P1ENY2_CUSEU|nr:unnamed protein product [Cuscuta europaea]
MDPTTDDQLDFDDEEYGESQKMQYHGGGTIPALAEEEMMGEDDEYDDLYNDVNVGEGFLQMQQFDAPKPPDFVGNGVSPAPENDTNEPRVDAITSPEMKPGVPSTGLRFPEQKSRSTAERGPDQTDASEKARPPSMTSDAQVGGNMTFQSSSVRIPHGASSDPVHDLSGKVTNESLPLLSSGAGGGGSSRAAPLMPAHQMSSNADANSPMINENHIRPAIENGNTVLFVGELHWWTTDADIESVLIQYGKVKEIKFFDERASGKSKGYCQVEFYDPASASACKDGMNGHIFNGRACVVAFATPHTIKQMGASIINNKTPTQVQTQPHQGRRPMNEGLNRGSGTSFPSGDTGRNFGRGGWGRGGQGMPNRGPGGGPGRGRGGMGSKNMMGGNVPGVNAGMGIGAYGQGLAGPGFGGPPGIMHPQGMMGPGFDPGYMGRGAGYGGFSGPGFPGMLPPFPTINPMGLTGVAPHVNPAFFGRGMGMMGGTTGMDGPHQGMWTDTSTGGGWGGGEEHERRTRESSYGGEDNASEYGYGDASHDKGGARSSAASREKERASERDWSGNSEKRNRDERVDNDRDRYDREHRYREERDGYRDYRHKEREVDYDNDRGHSSKSRSRSRAVQDEDHRSSRSRDADYGKRKRLPSE